MKFHKKYIKALKEGKLAIELQPPTNELHYLIKHINPKVSKILTTDKYLFNTKLGYMVSNELPIGIIAKSAKDFIKPSIETLTENDVVVCDNRKQRIKVIEAVHRAKIDGQNTNVVKLGDIRTQLHYDNIIPYRDLFPKRKNNWKRNIEKRLRALEKSNLIEYSSNTRPFIVDVKEIERIRKESYAKEGVMEANFKYDLDNMTCSLDGVDKQLKNTGLGYYEVVDKLDEQPKTDTVDWDKPGQTFQYSGFVVMNNGMSDDTSFEGFVIIGNQYRMEGEFCKIFDKSKFTPCITTIKINE